MSWHINIKEKKKPKKKTDQQTIININFEYDGLEKSGEYDKYRKQFESMWKRYETTSDAMNAYLFPNIGSRYVARTSAKPFPIFFRKRLERRELEKSEIGSTLMEDIAE